MDFEKFSAIAKALDRKDKVRIVDLVFTKGKKSITDVSRELGLNFSTAHSYLQELENAGILQGEKTSENGKVKKNYKINNFNFTITPEILSSLVRKRPIPESLKKKKNREFNIIAWEGNLQDFSTDEFKNYCLNAGIPAPAVNEIIEEINEEISEGFLVTDLQKIIFEKLEAREQSLGRMEKTLKSFELFNPAKNLLHDLEERNLQEVAKSHFNSNINIRNLVLYKPISFQHNLRYILMFGLKVIGMEAKPAKRLSSALGHIASCVNAVSKNLADSHQGFDLLNVFLAPLARNRTERELEQFAQETFYFFNQAKSINNSEVIVNLELEVPEFLKKEKVIIGGKEIGTYSEFEEETERLFKAFASVVENEKNKEFPKFVIKVRNAKKLDLVSDKVLKQVYFANLIPEWQTENANYARDWTRFDSSWKNYWGGTLGVPLMQYITLNLPRIALQARNESEVFELLSERIELAKQAFIASMENIFSKQLSKLPFLSAIVSGRHYCHLDDGSFAIALLGLTDTVNILNSKQGLDEKLAVKIVSFIKKQAEFKEKMLRVGLTESKFYPIQKSFTLKNNQDFKVNHSTYLGGIQAEGCLDKVIKYTQAKVGNEEKLAYYSKLHPLMLGGHLCMLDNLNKELLEKALKSSVGLIADKNAVLWP